MTFGSLECPNSVDIMQRHYSSLVHTSHDICAVVKHKVGLTNAMLKGQPRFPAVLEELLSWIGDTLDEVDQWQGVKHYPLQGRIQELARGGAQTGQVVQCCISEVANNHLLVVSHS